MMLVEWVLTRSSSKGKMIAEGVYCHPAVLGRDTERHEPALSAPASSGAKVGTHKSGSSNER